MEIVIRGWPAKAITRLQAAGQAAGKALRGVSTSPLGIPHERYLDYYEGEESALKTVDTLVEKEGIGIYRTMHDRDDQISPCVSLMILARLASDWDIIPGGGEEEDKKAHQLCVHTCENLEDGSMGGFLQDLMECIYMGHACVEPLWREPFEDGPFAGKQTIRSFVALPQESIRYKRDRHGQIEKDGIWQAREFGSMDPGMEHEGQFEKMPKSRFVTFAWRRRYNNPMGISMLRPAYRWYFIKDQLISWWARYLEYYGLPFFWGEVPENMGPNARAAVMNKLRGFQTQRVMVFDKGTKVNIEHPASMSAATASFDQMVNKADRGIARCLLTAESILDNPQVGTYALGAAQKGTYMWGLQDIGKALEDRGVEEQVFRPIVRHNHRPGVAVPKFRFKDFSQPDRVKIATMYQILGGLGFPVTVGAIADALGEKIPEGFDPNQPVAGPAPEDPMSGLPEEVVQGEPGLTALALDWAKATDIAIRDGNTDPMQEVFAGNGEQSRAWAADEWNGEIGRGTRIQQRWGGR